MEFAKLGFEVEHWVPWRYNPKLRGVDPFDYYHLEKNFVLRRLPAMDLMGIIPGSFSFFLMVATFNVSVVLYALFRGLTKSAVFYCLEIRDIVLLKLLDPHVFYEIHDFYKTPYGWLNRWCYRKARGVTATNIMKMKSFQKEFNVEPARMLHKPCPVDASAFRISVSQEEARKKLGISLDQKIVLYCGQVLLWKGVDGLLESHKYLGKNEFIYFIVGGDDKKVLSDFKEKHRALGARNVVIVEGQLHHDIPFWLKVADALVLPNTARDPVSKYDTSPLKLLEYMASSKPIVAADLPSIRNIVDDSMAWFYEPDNPKALADAVHAAFSEPDKSQKRCQKANEEVEKYVWERRLTDIRNFIITAL